MRNKTHTTLADRWIEIFKGGKQTDSKGKTKTFSESDLDEMVETHRSHPMVVGHPKTDSPSFGWSKDIKRVGLKLFGKYDDVNPKFDEAVKNKTYPNRSISIFKNPEGKFQVRHIGWLGGMPPAVDGLEAAFSDESDDYMEFSEWDTSRGFDSLSRLLRRMREWFIDEHDLETANKLIPDWEIDSIKDAADGTRPKDKTRLYNQGEKTMPKEYTDQEIDQMKKDAAAAAKAAAESDFSAKEQEYKTKLAEQQQATALAANQDFVKSLTNPADGKAKLTPAQADGMAEFMTQLDTGEVTINFSSEDDDKTVEKSGADWFKDFCQSLPTSLELRKTHMNGDAGDDEDKLPTAKEISDYAKDNGVSAAEAQHYLMNKEQN